MFLTTCLHHRLCVLSMHLQDCPPRLEKKMVNIYLLLLVHFDILLTQDSTHLVILISTLHKANMDSPRQAPIRLGAKVDLIMDGMKEPRGTRNPLLKMDKWVVGRMLEVDLVPLTTIAHVLSPLIITIPLTQCLHQALFNLQHPKAVFSTLMEGQQADRVSLRTIIQIILTTLILYPTGAVLLPHKVANHQELPHNPTITPLMFCLVPFYLQVHTIRTTVSLQLLGQEMETVVGNHLHPQIHLISHHSPLLQVGI